MAESRRDKGHLGLDSNVLVAYLLPDHPDHESTMFLTEESHAVNPTVLHETYHTCVFKLRRRPEDTVRTLSAYMDLAVCLRIDSSTVRQGLKLALNHSLGGRDSLILASYLMSKEVRALVTFDETLLRLGEIGMGKRRLKIVSPRPRFRT